jgi:hypothetical protein
MNWEAVLVIGAVMLVVGAVLLIPALFWARRKARANPGVPIGMAVTKSGLLISGTVVIILLVGFSAQYWASDTGFGRWMSTGFGRMAFTAATVAVTFCLGLVLGLFGVQVLRKRQ